MSSVKVARRDIFANFETDFKQQVFETGGEVFPDGQCIELIRANGGGLSLLKSRSNQAAETIKCANRQSRHLVILRGGSGAQVANDGELSSHNNCFRAFTAAGTEVRLIFDCSLDEY